MWIWDNRKTKAATEAKSVQEAMHSVFGAIKNCVNGKITKDNRRATTQEFGMAVEQLCKFAIALDVGPEVENYPRMCHQISTIPA
jgi:hypothetical protein